MKTNQTKMQSPKVIHLIPINDDKPHYEHLGCHCMPKFEVGVDDEGNGWLLITHNAFDGRK